jgi:hypothetical protein
LWQGRRSGCSRWRRKKLVSVKKLVARALVIARGVRNDFALQFNQHLSASGALHRSDAAVGNLYRRPTRKRFGWRGRNGCGLRIHPRHFWNLRRWTPRPAAPRRKTVKAPDVCGPVSGKVSHIIRSTASRRGPFAGCHPACTEAKFRGRPNAEVKQYVTQNTPGHRLCQCAQCSSGGLFHGLANRSACSAEEARVRRKLGPGPFSQRLQHLRQAGRRGLLASRNRPRQCDHWRSHRRPAHVTPENLPRALK